MSATIGALAPWFGSKRRLAPAIVEELGPHRAYWELFCGSMSVLLTKPEASAETVNDLHGDLINLARTVRDPRLGPALYRRLRRTWMHEEVFRESEAAVRSLVLQAREEPDPDRAYHYFVSSWMGRNGVSGTRANGNSYSVRYTKNGGHASTRFVSAVDSVPAWGRRLRRVVILSGDAFELLARIDDQEGTVIYCDPPYLVKGASYVHDFEPADHARLAESLRRFRLARVVVSYYDHPALAGLYPGWRVRDVEVTKALVNQGMRDRGGVVKAPEVLLVNGPLRGGAAGLPMFPGLEESDG